jgi:hypothetical protein
MRILSNKNWTSDINLIEKRVDKDISNFHRKRSKWNETKWNKCLQPFLLIGIKLLPFQRFTNSLIIHWDNLSENWLKKVSEWECERGNVCVCVCMCVKRERELCRNEKKKSKTERNELEAKKWVQFEWSKINKEYETYNQLFTSYNWKKNTMKNSSFLHKIDETLWWFWRVDINFEIFEEIVHSLFHDSNKLCKNLLTMFHKILK